MKKEINEIKKLNSLMINEIGDLQNLIKDMRKQVILEEIEARIGFYEDIEGMQPVIPLENLNFSTVSDSYIDELITFLMQERILIHYEEYELAARVRDLMSLSKINFTYWFNQIPTDNPNVTGDYLTNGIESKGKELMYQTDINDIIRTFESE